MKGIIMSLKQQVQDQISNPPIKYTGTQVIELKSDLKNLQDIVIKLAEEIDKINSKLKR